MSSIATELCAAVNKFEYSDFFNVSIYNDGTTIDFIMPIGYINCNITNDTITIRYTTGTSTVSISDIDYIEKAANKIIEYIRLERNFTSNKNDQTLANTICAHVTIGEYGDEVEYFIRTNDTNFNTKIDFITYDGVYIKCRIAQDTIKITHRTSLTNVIFSRMNSNCAEDVAFKILECIKYEVLGDNTGSLNIPLGTAFRMRELLISIKNARIELAEILGVDKSHSINRVCEEAADIVASVLKEEPVVWNAS